VNVILGRPLTGLVADTIELSNVDGPGSRFVVFLQGCNFDCVACHNPQTIPGHAPIEGHHPQRLTVDDLLVQIRRASPFIRGVTVSGGEATQQPAFIEALFTAIKADPATAHLTCLVDSNGACDLDTWDCLAPVMDGAMIDLKCLDSTIHEQMTGHPNQQVLASITHLHEIGRLHEVRLLLLAGINDDSDLVRRTAEWLSTIDREMQLELIGFRSHGARAQEPPLVEPKASALQEIADLMRQIAPFDIRVV